MTQQNQNYQQPYQQVPGQYPGYPQGPGYPQPPQKPKKSIWKRWWMICLYIIVAIILVVKVSGGGGEDSASTDAADTGTAGAASQAAKPAQKAAPAKKAGIGTPVTSSGLTFTVSEFKCGVAVNDGIQDLTPQGQFCKLSVTIANGGKDQATVDDSQIKVKDSAGNEYGTSSDTVTSDGSIFLKQINPGNKITGVAYYDVPKGTTPVTAEFRGSLLASPAEVSLS